MVDIVRITYALSEAVHIVNRSEYIVNRNIIGDKLRFSLAEHFFKLVFILSAVEDFAEYVEYNVLVNTAFLSRVKVNVRVYVNHTVGDNLYNLIILFGYAYIYNLNARVLHFSSERAVYGIISLSDNLACSRVGNGLG